MTEKLILFVQHDFKLSKKQADGTSLRDTYENLARQTGMIIDELQHTCPVECREIWNTFISLNQGRTSSGFGLNPITYTEIKSWCELYGVSLCPYEVGVIKRLDNIFLEHIAEDSKEKETK